MVEIEIPALIHEIPALIHKDKSYPSEYNGRVPKRIKVMGPVIEGVFDVWTDSTGKIFLISEGIVSLLNDTDKYEIIEWYYNGPHSQCEWNPIKNKPSEYLFGRYRDIRPKPTNGCQNEAVLRVGRKEIWHLCEKCAELIRFKRFKVRERLRIN